ncbi:hypothetical protein Scep_024590 [Stephania cephalantha]|uniref:Uncharacterized protein n=1 Tax=Stephania cephalantha TaxID=152367 RepID=A0AAP0HYL2_9MAGN
MESEKRLQDEFNGRRKLNGCALVCWLCLVVISSSVGIEGKSCSVILCRTYAKPCIVVL